MRPNRCKLSQIVAKSSLAAAEAILGVNGPLDVLDKNWLAAQVTNRHFFGRINARKCPVVKNEIAAKNELN